MITEEDREFVREQMVESLTTVRRAAWNQTMS